MKLSVLHLPAALAACVAVVLAGTPSASAVPTAPGPATGASTAAPVPPAPRDDDAVAATGRTTRIDVLANDGLPDPAAVRLMLVDPAAQRPGAELDEELRTDLGTLRVISPDTDPAQLPEGWRAPEHPVLALAADEPRPGPAAVEVGYTVLGPGGAEARAVLTVAPATPDAESAPSASPTGAAARRIPSASPTGAPARSAPSASPTQSAPTRPVPSASRDGVPARSAPAAEPSAGEPEAARSSEPSAGPSRATEDVAAAAAAQTPPAPAEVRRAMEAAAARAAARTGGATAAMRPWKGGWEWPHRNGVVLWSQAHGAHFVQLRGAIGDKWQRAGDVDVLGWPVTDEICGMADRGCRQAFSRSRTIYWSPATGAHPVNTDGAIGKRWGRAGWEQGAFGYPTSEEICGLAGGGCRQHFAKSRVIFWSSATGAHPVNPAGAIGRRWAQAGWEKGAYGYPAGGEICGLVDNGCRQAFSKARTIYWSPATGAHPVKTDGAIGRRWGQAGWEKGAFGYPTSDEVGAGTSSAHQKFRNGLMTWTTSAGLRTHMFRGECHHLNTGRSVQPTRDAARVSLTIAEGYGRSEATFVNCVRIAGSYVEEWRTSAHVGASGFKRPGVPSGHTQYLYSPQGSYSVTESFGVYNPGTALPYRQLNPNSRWGGRPGAQYNKYFESTDHTWPDENMWYFSQSGDYRLGAVINYNRPPDSPIVQGNGFAIFLHANKKPTAGCIALHEHEMARYLRTARPGDRIIMGVRADLFR